MTVDEDPLEWLWQRLYAADGHTTRCPVCARPRRFHRVTGRRAYACDHCGRQIYPTAETPFRGSTLPLEIWFAAVAILSRDPSTPTTSIASRLAVTPRAAARLRQRILATLADGGPCAELLAAIAMSVPAGPAPAPGAAAGDEHSDALDRISSAATRVIARKGMNGTRMVDIAHEAGVATATIHYYFKSREAVLLAALRWATEQWHSRLGDLAGRDLDPLLKLGELIAATVPTKLDQRDEYLVWLEAWVATRTHTRFLPACSAISRSWMIIVADVLADGARRGAFRLPAPPSEVAQRYVSLANDLAFRCVVGYEEMPAAAARRILTRFTAEQVGVTYTALQQAAAAVP